jgi:6-phosphogluconolactonase
VAEAVSLFGEVHVVDDVPSAFAALVAELAPGSLAFSGGGTAEECYCALARQDGIDWSRVEAFWGDERWVPVDDPESNEGMTRRVLLDGVPVGAVHSMREAAPTIEAAAEDYDVLVRGRGGLDVVHLGLGPDGHTASLFPGSPSLDEQVRWVIATGDDAHPHPRLTLTFPAIAASRVAIVTVAGEEKREAFRRVRDGDPAAPASHLRAERVIWLTDRAAHG